MSGSTRKLYKFSKETEDSFKSFRFGTSRTEIPQAKIYWIKKEGTDHFIEPAPNTQEVYNSLEDVADALPETTPRLVLLSYPCILKDGRKATPYVMLFYMPPAAAGELRMLYAGAKELVREKTLAGRVYEVSDDAEVIDVWKAVVEDLK